MNVQLSDTAGEIIERLVASGEYPSPEAVIESALRTLQTCDPYHWDSARAAVVQGEADVEAGRVAPWTSDIVANIKAAGRTGRAHLAGG